MIHIRQIRTLLAGAVLAFALTHPASAGVPHQTPHGEFSFFEMHISPPRAGTQRHPRGVSLDFHTLVGNDLTGHPDDAGQRAARYIDFRLPKGMRVNYRAFPSCKYSRLSRIGPPACPVRSKVGAGRDWTDFRPVIPTFFAAACSVFNGTDSHGAPALLAWCKTDFGASATASYNILPATPTSGPHFRLDQGPTSATGITPSFFGFDFSFPNHPVKVRSRRVSLLDAPDECRGSWLFSKVVTRYDRTSLTVNDREPCIQ